jgi:IPT/TIG domain
LTRPLQLPRRQSASAVELSVSISGQCRSTGSYETELAERHCWGRAFGGAAAPSVLVVSVTQITTKTPPHAQGGVNVTVTNPRGQSGTVAKAFTFVVLAPVVTSISPNTGTTAGGTGVTLTGKNPVSGAKATFGGPAATSVVVVRCHPDHCQYTAP